MAIHMAHPSVRLKGTEIDWTPLHCIDGTCVHTAKGLHLHCPFCTQDTSFTDQVILKAHYRVKHVDKAMEFAGLKILRCCRLCEVHGIIHERKHFKVPHWHCYHCHNGFNRRDEAMKHYKQHFRHPQTTIQIVIAQDVNQTMTDYPNAVPSGTSLVTHLIVPQSTHQPIQADPAPDPEETTGQHVHYQYTCSNDDHGTGENGEETVVLIEIPNDASKEDYEAEACYAEQQNGVDLAVLIQEKECLEKTLVEERAKWSQSEQKMKGTIERLRTKVEYLSNTNASLKQQLTLLHTSSMKRLTNDSDHPAILSELVQNMSEEHTQLLHHHLAQLRLFTEVCQLAKPPQEEEGSKQDQMDQGLRDQTQTISQMTMVPASAGALENMEQTVVMTITSEEVAQSLDSIKDSQEPSADGISLSLENDNNSSYELSTGLSPQSPSTASRQACQSDDCPSPRDIEVCDVSQQDLEKDKSLKMILSDGSKMFYADSLNKRTLADEMSDDSPRFKRRRTYGLKASRYSSKILNTS